MTSLLIDNLATLVSNDATAGSGRTGVLCDAAILVEEDHVAWLGPASDIPEGAGHRRHDAQGRALIPGFVDSHAHLVFAGDRSADFVARMAGTQYAAGGILTTVAATRQASSSVLSANVSRLVGEALAAGTTTIECKSGYGLSVGEEHRQLGVAAEHTDETTFLGAHTVPADFGGRADSYIELVRTEMLEACAPLARWVDVFCERGAFDADQCRAVLEAGIARGLGGRVHANQLGPGPGVQLAVDLGAASADHCSHLDREDIAALAGSRTVATLLPAAEFCLRAPYPDARTLLDAGVTIAIASDCNPGTSYTTNLPLCIALAVREMGLTPDEAVWAATAGGAAALRRSDVGHLGVGARFDAVLLDAPSHHHLAYRPGVPLVNAVWRAGRLAWATGRGDAPAPAGPAGFGEASA